MLKRREFLQKSALIGAGALTSSNLFAYRGTPGDKVIVGVMGTNSRGLFLAKTFANLPNVEVGYVCDPDAQVLAKTLAGIEKLTGKKPQGFADVRKLLERKDFDGLAIAAPTTGTPRRPSWPARRASTCTWKSHAATTPARANCSWKLPRSTKN